MKKAVFALTFVLAACAKAPAPGVAPTGKSSAEALSAFDDTRQQTEESLLRMVATALRAGLPLESGRAERCWREEAQRPMVRDSCALLWAGRGGPSPALEEAITEGNTRMLALALLQRRPLIGRLSFTGLMSKLDLLAQDPLWARAEMAEAWLEQRGSPGIAEGEALLARIRPRENSGPRDVSAALAAIRRIRAAAWRASFSAYCDPATRGEARLRCWRLLGAIDPEARLPETASLLPASPRYDDDWILFTRTFPRLARKLQAHLR
jgi:hypothetical protein